MGDREREGWGGERERGGLETIPTFMHVKQLDCTSQIYINEHSMRISSMELYLHLVFIAGVVLTLKATITTAADDKLCDIFPDS